jgi:hypothetical protein
VLIDAAVLDNDLDAGGRRFKIGDNFGPSLVSGLIGEVLSSDFDISRHSGCRRAGAQETCQCTTDRFPAHFHNLFPEISRPGFCRALRDSLWRLEVVSTENWYSDYIRHLIFAKAPVAWQLLFNNRRSCLDH